MAAYSKHSLISPVTVNADRVRIASVRVSSPGDIESHPVASIELGPDRAVYVSMGVGHVL